MKFKVGSSLLGLSLYPTHAEILAKKSVFKKLASLYVLNNNNFYSSSNIFNTFGCFGSFDIGYTSRKKIGTEICKLYPGVPVERLDYIKQSLTEENCKFKLVGKNDV